MTVRGKFYIQSVTKSASPGGAVTLAAAARGARNASWASASPSGSITMTINNPDAFAFFEKILDGAHTSEEGTVYFPEVFVDFSPATDGYPGDGHAFEPAQVPEGHYVAGRCAACGMDKASHA